MIAQTRTAWNRNCPRLRRQTRSDNFGIFKRIVVVKVNPYRVTRIDRAVSVGYDKSNVKTIR